MSSIPLCICIYICIYVGICNVLCRASSDAAKAVTQQTLEELERVQQESLAKRLASRGEETISVELHSLKVTDERSW